MSRIIVLNDFVRVKEILDGGTIFYVGRDLGLLAKYYKKEGFGPTRTKRLLKTILSERGYNPVQYDVEVNRAISAAKKYKIREISSGVTITKSEIDVIRRLPVDEGKVAFLMLVLARYEKFNSVRTKPAKENIGYFCWHRFEDIVKTAGLRKTRKQINSLKYRLDGELNIISATLISESNWRICFADDTSEPALFVENVENIMDYFPYFCDKCGIKLDKKSPRHSFCETCYKEKRREDVRENVRKFRVIR